MKQKIKEGLEDLNIQPTSVLTEQGDFLSLSGLVGRVHG
jgi:hypothetical protein